MKQNFLPILDPGHGGINPLTRKYVTSGKRSPEFKEGEIYYEGVGNRDIARRVGRMLTEAGWCYEYTVNPDDWRDRPLYRRTDIENSLNKSWSTFFISIHSNGYSKESAHGTEVWTSRGFTGKSDLGATIYIEEFAKEFPEFTLRKDTSDGDVDKESNLYVLKNTKGPAFLVEPLFHTNLNDYKILSSSKGRERLAKIIFSTILRINKELY